MRHRGVGRSAGRNETSRIDEYADDALSVVNCAQTQGRRPDARGHRRLRRGRLNRAHRGRRDRQHQGRHPACRTVGHRPRSPWRSNGACSNRSRCRRRTRPHASPSRRGLSRRYSQVKGGSCCLRMCAARPTRSWFQSWLRFDPRRSSRRSNSRCWCCTAHSIRSLTRRCRQERRLGGITREAAHRVDAEDHRARHEPRAHPSKLRQRRRVSPTLATRETMPAAVEAVTNWIKGLR